MMFHYTVFLKIREYALLLEVCLFTVSCKRLAIIVNVNNKILGFKTRMVEMFWKKNKQQKLLTESLKTVVSAMSFKFFL